MARIQRLLGGGRASMPGFQRHLPDSRTFLTAVPACLSEARPIVLKGAQGACAPRSGLLGGCGAVNSDESDRFFWGSCLRPDRESGRFVVDYEGEDAGRVNSSCFLSKSTGGVCIGSDGGE